MKLRLTMRPNSDGLVFYAEIRDLDGNSLVKIGPGTSNDKDVVKTTTLDVPSAKRLVLALSWV